MMYRSNNTSLLFVIAILMLPCSISAETSPYRILHVMSYHQSWKWNSSQLQGFKDGLGNLNLDYKIIELDTKRESDKKVIEKKVKQAKQIIRQWQPHLLYTNDDNAQKHLAQDYAGSSLPIVFSGLNREPSEYGFSGASNVTGVMEYEHFIPTLNLIRSFIPNIKKIAVIVDTDTTWKGVISRMRANVKRKQGIEISELILVKTLDQYQHTIKSLQDKVDAIVLLGIFNITDSKGKNVNYKKILQWTVNNSQIPDFAFWESRVDSGTLAVVAVSGYEQGLIAGKMARKILKDEISPGLLPISQSTKGQPMINITRSKALGIALDVSLLLNTTVKKGYSWDK